MYLFFPVWDGEGVEEKGMKEGRRGEERRWRDGQDEHQKLTNPRSLLVKAWNYSKWPAYKSRFWNKDGGDEQMQPQVQARVP